MNGGRENFSPSAYWGQVAYTKYLESHPDYTINPGDILFFLIVRFPVDLTAIPVCVFFPHEDSQLLLVGSYNPETRQSQTGEISSPPRSIPFTVFSSWRKSFRISS